MIKVWPVYMVLDLHSNSLKIPSSRTLVLSLRWSHQSIPLGTMSYFVAMVTTSKDPGICSVWFCKGPTNVCAKQQAGGVDRYLAKLCTIIWSLSWGFPASREIQRSLVSVHGCWWRQLSKNWWWVGGLIPPLLYEESKELFCETCYTMHKNLHKVMHNC